MKKIAAVLIIAAFLLLAGVVSAQTYDAVGSNQNGAWASTLYMGDNGEMGISLIAVVGGSFTPVSDPDTQQLSLGASYNPILSQQYKINAENGLGFAACSLDDAQGNHADTYVNVTNGVVTTEQEVGFVDKECSSGVYSSQELDESCAELIQAEAAAEGANGDWAEVEAYASGFVKCVEQYAQTTTETPELLGIPVGFHSESKTYAEQEVEIGSKKRPKSPADWGFVEATALDHLGNLALANATVYNGTLDFCQSAKIESDECTELSTSQLGDLCGTSGTIENYAGNAAGDIYSHVKINFTNECPNDKGSLTLLLPGWSAVETNGDTDTEAGLLLTKKSGTTDHFGVYADTQGDSDSTHSSILKCNHAGAFSDDNYNNAWVFP
jgi:hypothetical protein